MSDAERWSAVRAALVKIFNETVVPVGAPHMLGSGWQQDELARGAYTYAAVGTSRHTCRTFQESLPGGRVHFAGEHTSEWYRGTVHGALLSG